MITFSAMLKARKKQASYEPYNTSRNSPTRQGTIETLLDKAMTHI